MQQAKVTVYDNGHDWWLVELRWGENEATSFGFPDKQSAMNALKFAKYCLENGERLEDVTIK